MKKLEAQMIRFGDFLALIGCLIAFHIIACLAITEVVTIIRTHVDKDSLHTALLLGMWWVIPAFLTIYAFIKHLLKDLRKKE